MDACVGPKGHAPAWKRTDCEILDRLLRSVVAIPTEIPRLLYKIYRREKGKVPSNRRYLLDLPSCAFHSEVRLRERIRNMPLGSWEAALCFRLAAFLYEMRPVVLGRELPVTKTMIHRSGLQLYFM
jgi:hypothetical protein